MNIVKAFILGYVCGLGIKCAKKHNVKYAFDDSNSDEIDWVTAHGTHVPVKNGKLQGEIGEKIEWDSPEQKKSRKDAAMQALDLIQSGKATSVKLKGIRNDLDKYGGSNDVTIYQGDEKYGLKHIERRHGKKCFKPVLEAVANGKIARYEDRNRTVAIQLNNYEAVLSLNQNGKNKTWLLTGYDIIEDYRKNKK